MKDKDFEELKNIKIKPIENKINYNNYNINKKNSNNNISNININYNNNNRNAQSRLRSLDKTQIFPNIESLNVNKRFSRAESSSFKFYQANNILKKKESDINIRGSNRRNTIGKSVKKNP
jgi:hypothetical protein